MLHWPLMETWPTRKFTGRCLFVVQTCRMKFGWIDPEKWVIHTRTDYRKHMLTKQDATNLSKQVLSLDYSSNDLDPFSSLEFWEVGRPYESIARSTCPAYYVGMITKTGEKTSETAKRDGEWARNWPRNRRDAFVRCAGSFDYDQQWQVVENHNRDSIQNWNSTSLCGCASPGGQSVTAERIGMMKLMPLGLFIEFLVMNEDDYGGNWFR